MLNLLRACADWRVIATLVAIGAGVAVLAPNLIAAAIPFLLIAACPLSMLVMMRAMGSHKPDPSQRLEPVAVDLPAQLRARLAAVQLEQERLKQELARVDSANLAPTASRATAAVVEAPARSN